MLRFKLRLGQHRSFCPPHETSKCPLSRVIDKLTRQGPWVRASREQVWRPWPRTPFRSTRNIHLALHQSQGQAQLSQAAPGRPFPMSYFLKQNPLEKLGMSTRGHVPRSFVHPSLRGLQVARHFPQRGPENSVQGPLPEVSRCCAVWMA